MHALMRALAPIHASPCRQEPPKAMPSHDTSARSRARCSNPPLAVMVLALALGACHLILHPADYYAGLERRLLARGLLQTDGGAGVPYSTDDLVRNFETIAFFDEHVVAKGGPPGAGQPHPLRRWETPVRMGVEFGHTVPAAQAATDRAQVRVYARRLAELTGHPIDLVDRDANFHVLFMGREDRAQLEDTLKRILPNLDPSLFSVFLDPSHWTRCLVAIFPGDGLPNVYVRALALIRAEHPDLLRLSCIHEELAQGLGVSNDSRSARPSIFNDNDEFALLTRHDEDLLRMLYDPRLAVGMDVETARPIARTIADVLLSDGIRTAR